MFRFVAILLLLGAFTAQTFYQAVMVLDYYLRTAAYEKVCENKARPELHCKGKCQVARKLKEEEKKDRQAPLRKLEQKADTLSSETFFMVASLLSLPALRHPYPVLNTGAPPAQAYAIFHPPALI
jgi:hypothetical protein